MCIRKKTKKICDLCLYRGLCPQDLTNNTYCDQFCHKKQGMRLLCDTCRHQYTCEFNRYAEVVCCMFYLKN